MNSKILRVSHEDKEQLEKLIKLLKDLGYEVSEVIKKPTNLENALTELSANLQDGAIRSSNT